MADLYSLKAMIDTDPNRAAVRTIPTPSGTVSTVVYRDIDGYYAVTSLNEEHKECWLRWDDAVGCVGTLWAGAEDWMAQQRESPNDLLTLQYVALRLNVSEDSVRRWVKSGSLEAVPLPVPGKNQMFRVRRSTLEKILQKTTMENSPVAVALAS